MSAPGCGSKGATWPPRRQTTDGAGEPGWVASGLACLMVLFLGPPADRKIKRDCHQGAPTQSHNQRCLRRLHWVRYEALPVVGGARDQDGQCEHQAVEAELSKLGHEGSRSDLPIILVWAAWHSEAIASKNRNGSLQRLSLICLEFIERLRCAHCKQGRVKCLFLSLAGGYCL